MQPVRMLVLPARWSSHKPQHALYLCSSRLTCVVQEGVKKPACILHASAAPCELRIQPAPGEARSPEETDDLYRRLGLVLNVEEGEDARLRINIEAPAARDDGNQNVAARPQKYQLDVSQLNYNRIDGLSFKLPSATLVRSTSVCCLHCVDQACLAE